jgi:hypothetical protein
VTVSAEFIAFIFKVEGQLKQAISLLKNGVFWDVTAYGSYKSHTPYHPRRRHSS